MQPGQFLVNQYKEKKNGVLEISTELKSITNQPQAKKNYGQRKIRERYQRISWWQR